MDIIDSIASRRNALARETPGRDLLDQAEPMSWAFWVSVTAIVGIAGLVVYVVSKLLCHAVGLQL